MAITFSGTSEYYLTSSTPVTGPPLTFAVWGNVGADANVTAMAIGGSTAGTEALAIRHVATARSVAMRAESTVGGTDQSTTGTMVTGTWAHMSGTSLSTSTRTAFFNGTAGTANTATNDPQDLDRIGVGSIADNAPASVEWNGDLYAQAIWDTVLSAEDLVSLANGVSPLRVRRANLVFLSILDTLVPTDLIGGRTLAVTGTPVMAQDPPNFMRGPLRGRERRSRRM